MRSKGYRGIGMNGFIARGYDRDARQPGMMEIYRSWAQRFAARMPDGGRLLEVAPGPGLLAIELARLGGFRVVGLEISETFVELARRNAGNAGVDVEFLQGNASDMPFAGATFDGIVCTSAFKNFQEPARALREMHRVLRPGGKAMIDDLRHDVSDRAIDDWILNVMKVKGRARFFMKMTFKHLLRKRAYTRGQFEGFIAQTPFERVEIEEQPMGFEIWLTR